MVAVSPLQGGGGEHRGRRALMAEYKKVLPGSNHNRR
jgi:hypothetical protein